MDSFSVLRKVFAAYEAQRDQITDPDLDDEQPITLNVSFTLGDIRKMRRKLDNMELAKKSFGGGG